MIVYSNSNLQYYKPLSFQYLYFNPEVSNNLIFLFFFEPFTDIKVIAQFLEEGDHGHL